MGGRVAVLVSGSGTNLQALLDDAAIRPHLSLVLSDRPGVFALQRAADAGVESLVIEPTGDRAELTSAVAEALDGAGHRSDRERRLHARPRATGRRALACTDG